MKGNIPVRGNSSNTESQRHLEESHNMPSQECDNDEKQPPHDKFVHSEMRPEIDASLISVLVKPPVLKLPAQKEKKRWKEIDTAIGEELGFHAAALQAKDLDDAVHVYEQVIWSVLEKQCGVLEKLDKKPPPDPARRFESQQRKLRKEKQRLKKAYKVSVKEKKEGKEFLELRHQFYRCMRQHSKLRKKITKVTTMSEECRQQLRFRRDPYRFAKDLVSPPKVGEVKFSADDLTSHFKKTYFDAGRAGIYNRMKGMKQPPVPTDPFEMSVPTMAQIEGVIRKKRTKNAPGINGIPYAVYKNCASLLFFLHLLFKRVWREQHVPKQWQLAIIILLLKKDNPEHPSAMRPIALLNVEGRLFFTLMQTRLSRFMLDNKYWDKQVQKGFLEKVAGCIEHSELLVEALLDAKRHQRAICVSFLDLENAYGSVRHSLVQFAMSWYHIPKEVRQIFFCYYDKLFARALLPGGDGSEAFQLGIGVFQGCTASTVIFNIVENLEIDFTKQSEGLGYHFVDLPIRLAQILFADDNTKVTPDARSNQCLLNLVHEWLQWTETMRAKPPKCRSMAFKRFATKNTLQGTEYSAYDPELKIGDTIIPFLWDADFVFKFLGRLIQADLGDDRIRETIKGVFLSMMDLIDSTKLTGPMKAWIYEMYIMAKISWQLLIHDLPISWVESQLYAPASRYLKKWLRLAKPANINIFYRSKEHFGLHMKHLPTFAKIAQTRRAHLVKYSDDPALRQIYAARMTRQAEEKTGLRARWRASTELEQAETAIAHQRMVGKVPVGRQGVGYGQNYEIEPNPVKIHRQQVCAEVEKKAEAARYVEECDHVVQGEWQRWGNLLPRDMSFERMCFGSTPDLVRFELNATMDTCPTPANLERWSKLNIGRCQICYARSCTLSHILSCCHVSLTQGRYTWRHDSVLLVIEQALSIAIRRGSAQHRLQKRPTAPPASLIAFVKADDKPKGRHRAVSRVESIINDADDWKVLFDLHYDESGRKHQAVFPPELLATGQMPDGLVWSAKSRCVILLELTVPWETRIADAHIRKQRRYNQIQTSLEMCQPAWKVVRFDFEVGVRGYLDHSVQVLLKGFGLSGPDRKACTARISDTALHCSYVLFLNRANAHWMPAGLLRKFLIQPAPPPTD